MSPLSANRVTKAATPDQILIVVCLIAAVVFYGLSSTVVSVLGRSHSHSADSSNTASNASTNGSSTSWLAVSSLRPVTGLFVHKAADRLSSQTAHSEPEREGLQRPKPSSDANRHVTHQAHDALLRHHHPATDMSVQSAEAAAAAEPFSGDAFGSLNFQSWIIDAMLDLRLPAPGVRLLQWHPARDHGLADGHARLPERPPKT